MCWFKPSHWRGHHPLKSKERAGANSVNRPNRYTDPQHRMGAESFDRADDVSRE